MPDHNQNKSLMTDLSITELGSALAEMGEPRFRLAQVMKWLYQKRIASFDEMTNVSKKSREKIAGRFALKKPAVRCCLESSGGDAVKFGLEPMGNTADRHVIECVLLFDGKRRTACVSSQLGCGLGCTFCETAKLGFIRNLSLAEIMGQLLVINDYLESKKDHLLTNIVFMGMGEALFNFEAVRAAIEIITSDNGLVLAPWRITISTAGVVPSIEKLAAAGLGVQLAISLNHYSNEKRDALMPINRKYPIEKVIDAARNFAHTNKHGVTFEYVVLEGENDTPEAVNALVKMLHGLRCKINLIPLNAAGGVAAAGGAQDTRRIAAFAQALFDRGIVATVRKSRGRDICGACGQLAGRLRKADRYA